MARVRHVSISDAKDYVNSDEWITYYCPSEKCNDRRKRSILGQTAALRGNVFIGKCRRCGQISAFIVD